MSNEKITVIIPIYNTKDYLRQCIDSVINQKYKPIEIILVNDGSDDGSIDICHEYRDKYSNVILKSKENGGLADARNAGLSCASGDWILFLDSDDYYEDSETFETLVKYADIHNSDIVCFNYKRFFDNTKHISSTFYSFENSELTLDELIHQNIYQSSACLKLIRRTLIQNHNMVFEKGVLSEDIEFSAKLLLYTQKISFCEQAMYIYRMRSGSITKSISQKHIQDLVNVISKCTNMFNCCENKKTRENGLSFTAFQYCTLLINMRLTSIDKVQRKTIFNMKDILNHDKNKVVNLINKTRKMIGINITSLLLWIYFSIISPALRKNS
ncbi:MAG: glycosyltransferase [Oscillospiraceae bacterium]